MRRLIATLCSVSILVMTGCSHTVSIDSDPPGAKIKVNGQHMGNGPVMFTETTGWEKSYEVVAEKPGFKTSRRYVKQTEWNVGVLAASIICGGPTLIGLAGIMFSRQLPDRVVVTLEEGSDGGGSDSSGGGGDDSVDDYGY
jgi:hypothetical protein